jgi:alkyl hydroperoxide reductase subunit AhpF
MKRDPVCNMEAREEDAVTAECNGEVLYFCSEGCREKFLKERLFKVPRTSYDLIIIGAGQAGLTAGVYAATLRVDAFLIGKILGGQAVDCTKIENYMGYDFIRGPELIEKFQYQLIHAHYIGHLIGDVERSRRLKAASAWQRLNWYATSQRP